MKKKKKNIYYNKFEIEQMEKELMEEAKDFLCSIYNRSNNDVIENIYRKFNTDWEIINKTIIMKEKSCKTCKNKLDGIMVDQYGHRGEVHECSKNHLDIGNQYTHSCDMHEENKADKKNRFIVQKIELVMAGVEVTVLDLDNNGSEFVFVMGREMATKLVVGNMVDLTFR